jgi:hypothetical protein
MDIRQGSGLDHRSTPAPPRPPAPGPTWPTIGAPGCVAFGTLIEAERQAGDPQVVTIIAREGRESEVVLTYFPRGGGRADVNLAEELGFSGPETVGLFRWAESEGYIRPSYGSGGRNANTATASLDHLEGKGYELIGELPDPQERLALILDATIQAVPRDISLGPEEKQQRIDWFEEAKIVVRTLGIEVAKAVWRGDLPPM